MAPCAPPPLRLPGQQAPKAKAVVVAGGCQHPRPRGAPAQVPALPPSQARLWAGVVVAPVEAAETLEGPALGAGAPHYCFISRGPAMNNAGHETQESDPKRSPESQAGWEPGHQLPGDPGAQSPGLRLQPGQCPVGSASPGSSQAPLAAPGLGRGQGPGVCCDIRAGKPAWVWFHPCPAARF